MFCFFFISTNPNHRFPKEAKLTKKPTNLSYWYVRYSKICPQQITCLLKLYCYGKNVSMNSNVKLEHYFVVCLLPFIRLYSQSWNMSNDILWRIIFTNTHAITFLLYNKAWKTVYNKLLLQIPLIMIWCKNWNSAIWQNITH